MNVKRLLSAAAFLALAVSAMPSANAASINGTVTVKWNTVATGTLTLANNYTIAAGVAQANCTGCTVTPGKNSTVLAQANGGAGLCTALGAAEAATTVNFNNITGDATHWTDCQYVDAVNALAVTSDPNWSLAVVSTAPAPAPANGSFTLCGYANNVAAIPAAINTAPALSTQTALTIEANQAASCTANGSAIPQPTFLLSPAPVTLASSTTTASSNSNVSSDYQLITAPGTSTGSFSETVTYTLTMN
jgi:hypothetical protein